MFGFKTIVDICISLLYYGHGESGLSTNTNAYVNVEALILALFCSSEFYHGNFWNIMVKKTP